MFRNKKAKSLIVSQERKGTQESAQRNSIDVPSTRYSVILLYHVAFYFLLLKCLSDLILYTWIFSRLEEIAVDYKKL